MSWEQHEDDCPGCRPALLDPTTGKAAAPDSPEMQVVNRVWSTTTVEERHAFHRVTCQNSRDDADMTLVQGICERIGDALKATVN